MAATGCSDDQLPGETTLGPSGEPSVLELGQRLIPDNLNIDLVTLSSVERDLVFKGSYLVNGVGSCSGCHNSEAGYLAGGRECNASFLPPAAGGHTSVFVRNLTPDPETGLKLTESEFITAMKTGKDFHDSGDDGNQRMLFMPVQPYRFLLDDDLKAIYAFLRSIPPVRNEFRMEFVPPFPFPPYTAPAISQPGTDGDGVERGLQIPRFFSSGPEADAFVLHFENYIGSLSSELRARVGRGSYLVNAMADCGSCHTDGVPDGNPDNGLLPGTIEVNAATYLGGGVNFAGRFRLPFDVFSRNLTPHPDTGLELTEEQFIQTLRFGADFRRPTGSLRISPHFPAQFRLTLEDARAIYAFLKSIPPVENEIQIVP